MLVPTEGAAPCHSRERLSPDPCLPRSGSESLRVAGVTVGQVTQVIRVTRTSLRATLGPLPGPASRGAPHPRESGGAGRRGPVTRSVCPLRPSLPSPRLRCPEPGWQAPSRAGPACGHHHRAGGWAQNQIIKVTARVVQFDASPRLSTGRAVPLAGGALANALHTSTGPRE